MNKIIIDDVLREKLNGLHEPLTLCDKNGKALAFVAPVADAAFYDSLDSPNSKAELDRREREGGGRLLSEILTDLNHGK